MKNPNPPKHLPKTHPKNNPPQKKKPRQTILVVPYRNRRGVQWSRRYTDFRYSRVGISSCRTRWGENGCTGEPPRG